MTVEELQLKAERRARREERRAKQRVLNVKRAAEMHAARVAYEKEEGLEEGERRGIGGLHVGCSGWYYWHWKFSIYENVPSKEWFRTYAAKFDTVELNAPFYGWPTVKTVGTWVRQVEGVPSFRYTVKGSELITHVKRFVGTKTLVKDFSYIGEMLGERMGAFLWQVPPSYRFTSARLKAIATQLEGLSSRFVNVAEFRHKSWWNEEVQKVFREAGVVFCSSSGPRMPDELVETGEVVYLRFHGTEKWYRHDYSAEELSVWAEWVRKSGAKTVYAYFNNDREGNAHRNAEVFRGMLVGRARGKRRGGEVA